MGHRLPGALGHDLGDVVIAEPEMLADKRAGDRPRRGLSAEPGLADFQDLRSLSGCMKLSHSCRLIIMDYPFPVKQKDEKFESRRIPHRRWSAAEPNWIVPLL
jgi:hypothetical protein